MSFISHSTQDFDHLKRLDSPEPNFELFGREEQNARVNDVTFELARTDMVIVMRGRS